MPPYRTEGVLQFDDSGIQRFERMRRIRLSLRWAQAFESAGRDNELDWLASASTDMAGS